MQRTDNFNLIVVEGSDTVNLLTQMNPNTEVIDEQMFKNQNAGVQTATELLSGTVHAITRSIPDASMIRFTAVSRFTAGDTFTVDGVQVSALLPSGEQLPDGAFIIGSEVLCVLKGTLLTVFASGGAVALARDSEKLGGELPEYYATKAEVDSAQETARSAGTLAETAINTSNSAITNIGIIKNYVNDEVVIGSWVDGNPLYRKYITGTYNLPQGGVLMIDSTLNVNEISLKKLDLVMHRVNDDYIMPNTHSSVQLTADGLQLTTNVNYQYGTFECVAEYTKK